MSGLLPRLSQDGSALLISLSAVGGPLMTTPQKTEGTEKCYFLCVIIRMCVISLNFKCQKISPNV